MDEIIVGTYVSLTLACVVVIMVVVAAGCWKAFEKAGYEGWLALVPVLNVFVLVQIAEKPDWWILLYFVPIANVFAGVVVSLAVAERFGRSVLFGLGLYFFPYVCYPVLGYGYDEYVPDAELDA